MGQGKINKTDQKQRLVNLTLAGVAGSSGCITLVIVLAALLIGLMLDNRFDTRPIMTIVLVIVSIPISLAAMLIVVRLATSKIKAGLIPPKQGAPHQPGESEEDDLGRNA